MEKWKEAILEALIVDDEATVRSLIRRELENRGVTVAEVATIAAARDAVGQ